MNVHDVNVIINFLRSAGIEDAIAVSSAQKLQKDGLDTLNDLKRIATTSTLKDYLSDPSDVLKVQKKALLLGDKTWSTSSTPNKQSSTSDDVPDGLEEKHLPIYQHLISLGIDEKESTASVKKLYDEGYHTVTDFKELSKNKDRLMRFFNKLGTVDRLHRSSATNELEEMALSEVIKFDTADRYVHWNDIAGLKFAKETLREAIVLPRIIPHIFNTLLRAPPLGVLLFGPPGTGKTLLAKAVGTSVRDSATFFSISAASINSKWFGESEKVVRALFVTARKQEQSIIFIDEIDSLLSSRGMGMENDAARKVKTEFMVQLSGINHQNGKIGQLLVIAATNRPWDLDSAVVRRLAKRIYVPLPGLDARASLMRNALLGDVVKEEEEEEQEQEVKKEMKKRDTTSVERIQKDQETEGVAGIELQRLAALTEGYSGSDLFELCREASTVRLRSLDLWNRDPTSITSEMVRRIEMSDFEKALQVIRPSVAPLTLKTYEEWNLLFGSDPKSQVINSLNNISKKNALLTKEKEHLAQIAQAASSAMGGGGHGIPASKHSNSQQPDASVLTKVASALRSWYGKDQNNAKL